MDILDEIEASLPALRRFAHALVHDRARAETLVQEALELALSRRGQGQADGRTKEWLFCIFLNRFRESLRGARPVLAPVAGGAAAQDRPRLRAVGAAAQDGLAATIGARGEPTPGGDLGGIHEAIGRLPPDQRAALLLVALEGLSFETAGRLCGSPRGMMMARVARARSALRGLTGRLDPALFARG